MRRVYKISLALGFFLLISAADVKEKIRRVNAHILIDDAPSALNEASTLADEYPDSDEVKKVLIEALAINGHEREALFQFDELTKQDPNLIYDRYLLEEIAWGVLKKGTYSTQYAVRLAATIGSFLTKDVRAIPVLIKMMRDSNAIIRSVAVQLASNYQDAPLKDEIRRLFFEEKVWIVRLEVIQAAGLLKMKDLTEELRKLVQSERTLYEERQIAINALLQMYETISIEEIEALAKSNRAGFRHLACSIAVHFQMKEAKDVIQPLLYDTNSHVKIAALNAFGLLFKGTKKDLKPVINDRDPSVAITACWAAALIDMKLGEKGLLKWIESPFAENRRMAAAAIASLGSRGVKLAKKVIQISEDPYVLTNVALGLIGQRENVESSCDLISKFLNHEKRMIMIDTSPNPLFEIIAPSRVRHNDQIPNFPEAQDQMTRLNLVSLLAVVEDKRAFDVLKSFLGKKTWGISGVAAATLISEGDEDALEIVKELTKDSDPNVSLQACLVLAMFGKDESVLRSLQNAYGSADHDKKLHILEALGKIGTPESFGFLVSVLNEPFPILRVAAAAALIQSVNR